MLPPDSELVAVDRSGVLTAYSSTRPSPWVRIALVRSTPRRENRDSPWASSMRFSDTLKLPMAPSRMRSSGMKASPASRTRLGSAPVTSVPSIDTLPAVTGRRPAIASASSRWPLPETPAMPRMRPPRTSTSRSLTAAVPLSPSTVRPRMLSRTPRSGVSAMSGASFTGRPTIMWASPSRSVSAGTVVPTTQPSRSTVIRSARASTSWSLCEMNTRPRPSLAIRRRVMNRSSTSPGVSTAVGSSSTSSRASRSRALMISTRWRSPTASCQR